MKPSRDTCYNCGCVLTKGNSTGDHIPPKGVFPDSLKDDQLIKVPCCYECNHAHKRDDELLLYLAGDSRASISSAPIADKVARALACDKSFIRASFEKVLQGASRIDGNSNVDIPIPIEIEQCFGRMVKGLLYELCERRNLQDLIFHAKQTVAEERERMLHQAKYFAHSITKGGDIFRADWIILPEQPDVGMWWITLFNCHVFRVTHHAKNTFNCPGCR